jgi:hypothetical protein
VTLSLMILMKTVLLMVMENHMGSSNCRTVIRGYRQVVNDFSSSHTHVLYTLIFSPASFASCCNIINLSFISVCLCDNNHMSSAKSRSSNLSFIPHCIPLFLSPNVFLITLPSTSKNMTEDKIQPCLTALKISA